MSTTRTPRVAGWLLRRFAGGPAHESLIGDLDEQVARGRSTAWCWRQAVWAIAVGVTRDLRAHRWLAVRSILVTTAIVVACAESTGMLYAWVSEKWVYAWVNRSALLFEFWIPFGGGLPLVWCLGSALGGWLCARQNRGHAAAMAINGAFAQVPAALWWSRSVWLHACAKVLLHDYATEKLPVEIWLPNYLWAVIVIVGIPASCIIGGLWAHDLDATMGNAPDA